ncbi:hypothetical protein QFC19_002963 [Naganishia cerealis]|uniref:Uncharacterized protein n=1 Tax=Naganishia cerealis TaxID=610337 RepID=A0ACC2W662_9TREE|nr:hypothetical protein QFC19_002963 [Naganishia cerealis]
MGHGGGLGAGGYYYPSGNAGPMMGMGMNMGMGPGGAGMNGVVAPGYGGMGMGMGGGVVPGMMMGPAMQPPTGINHNGPAPGGVGMGMGMGMGGMQNGAAGMSRFPPAFTPQSQVHAAPQQQLGSLGPGLVGHVNGVNGSGAAGGNGQASSSPYPAYHHASSAATSSSVTSPSLSNTTVNTATTPATTATTTVTVGSASGSVSSPPPNDAASTPTPGSGARSMSSYLPSGMEQNPYAHLHQQHASHPHHNPYANMQPGAGPASNIPLGMSPAAYGNGGLYQPYGPPHQQQPMQNGPPGGPLSPAHMHAPIHSLSVTPKMNHRTSYGYPVLPTTNSTAASGPLRKPSVVISAHDSGISVLGSQSGRRPSISESSLLNVDGAVVEDDESGSEVDDEQASDGEPVFASINQAVAKKAKKSKRKPQPQPQQTEDVKSPSVRLEETVVAEAKQVEEAKETNVLGPAVSLDTEATPPITDTFTDELESFHNDDPSGSRPKRSQWISAGRPHPIETAPGVVFNQSTAIPARLYPIINTWDQIERKGKSGKAKGKMRSQTNAVSLQKRRRAGKGLEVEFGEVSQSVLAEVMRAKEEASALQQNMATDTQQELSNNPPQPSKPTEEVVLKVTDDAIKAEQTTESEAPAAVGPISVDSITPVPTPASVPATSPSPAQASPVAKATPKSWAALLRGPIPKSTPATSAPASVPSSNVTSPTLAQSAVMEQVPGSNEHQSPKKVIVVDGVMTPGGATTPAAPAKPANAWGARPMIVPDQLDLGRLLAEGLDERTRASLKKVTSVPRGLINTGNMCFANSVSQRVTCENPTR